MQSVKNFELISKTFKKPKVVTKQEIQATRGKYSQWRVDDTRAAGIMISSFWSQLVHYRNYTWLAFSVDCINI